MGKFAQNFGFLERSRLILPKIRQNYKNDLTSFEFQSIFSSVGYFFEFV
jgi:hypothetical protein